MGINRRKFKFRYYMKLEFDEPVREHRFTLKCMPQTTDTQEIGHLEMDVFPNRFISEGQDSFGNASVYGYTKEEHDRFYFDVRGTAFLGKEAGEKERKKQRMGLFKYQTPLTVPGEGLKKYHASLGLEQMEHLENTCPVPGLEERTELQEEGKKIVRKANYIMEHLYQDFSYEKGVTEIATTAEAAWNLKQGVCQDYAHIMLSLCRMERIPCRYVTGMIVGEGMSHAWIEVCADDIWFAFDPTNHVVVKDDHIKISIGRDYNDCIVNQGVFTGNAGQKQKIIVNVEEST